MGKKPNKSGFPKARLETLSETSGKFILNEELPIPFDGRGRMEVDFLCRDARLVIELDGDQHLSDPEAYRSDRRKDAWLQESVYFVLRFLVVDLGKHLDHGWTPFCGLWRTAEGIPRGFRTDERGNQCVCSCFHGKNLSPF